VSGVTVAPAGPAELEAWDRFVDASPQGTPFHRLSWLRAMAAESRCELVPLAASAGDGLAAVLPVFAKRRMKLRVLFSPPPGCAVPSLGPVLRPAAARKAAESLYASLAEGFDEWMREARVDLARVAMHRSLADVRPFTWRGFSASPSYEYVVPIGGSEEEVFAAFDSETRTKVRRAQKYPDLVVEDGGVDDALWIAGVLRARYAEQGRTWGVSDGYLRAVLEGAAPGTVGVKVARSAGEPVTGMVTLYYRDVAQDWIGGMAPLQPLSGVNELLHWSIIRGARAAGAAYYDLGGANTPHLARSKSKYAPALVPHFTVEKAGTWGRAVSRVATSPLGRAVYARLR
jgi:hypothetical protein